MKKKDIKKMTKDQAKKDLEKFKKDLFNLRFQKTNGQLTDFSKVVKVRKKFSAHDENNKFKNGDKVKIIECRPYSKTKKFEVILDK